MVYFILNPHFEMPAVKIGTAKDSRKRLDALQSASANRLILLGEVIGGRDEEMRFHEHFSERRIRGEWFKSDQGFISEITAIVNADRRRPCRASSWEPAELLVFHDLLDLLGKNGWMVFSLKGSRRSDIDGLVKDLVRCLTNEQMHRVYDAVEAYCIETYGAVRASRIGCALDHRFDGVNGWWA